MHVMFTVAEMGSGGAEAVVATLVRGTVAGGADVTVASHGGWRAAELRTQGVRLVPVPLRGRRPVDITRAIVALHKQQSRSQVDLVHAHNVKSAVVSAAGSPWRQHVPLVVTLHGVPNGSYHNAARLLRRSADWLVAVSDDVAERVSGAGFPSSRMSVIENAIDTPRAHDRSQARSRLGISPEVPVALCVARLVPQKRHDLLVDAWRRMPNDAVLVIAGDGATRPSIEKAIKQSGQADRIRLLGERHDIDWLLAAADVCVLPTDWEGLPISVLEAMAAGVPVVGSAVTGMSLFSSDAIELVPPGSSSALADGLRHVLFDEGRRRQLTTAGVALTRDRFSPAHMWQQYRSLYAFLSPVLSASLREVTV
jgi:glycosyltransferase involved in cell wall biosynthesis